jgi:hypothetical protein
MRAWVILCALLVASAAAAQDREDPNVPALGDGELAPDDVPNYFDARELGVATLAALMACEDAFARAEQDVGPHARALYCGCFADAARSNARAERAVTPTAAQVAKCAQVAQGKAQSPFARAAAISRASIRQAFHACMEANGDGASASYRAFLCSCTTNAWIAHRLRPAKLDEDRARCDSAARYRERTGQSPTLREFTAIRVTRTAQPAGRSDPDASRLFIPYPGNGRGPTLCRDGMYSHSSGRGTCSHHGGIAGGRSRRR